MSPDTLDYYQEHTEEYARETDDLDLGDLHERFLALLPPRGRILDAGCGPGRDARAFQARGYRVAAYDGSARMAARASRRLGIPVATRRFLELDEQDAFDGVWASASFLHAARQELPEVLARHLRALRPGGVLFLSLKQGEGERRRDGRLFTLIGREELQGLFDQLDGAQTLEIWDEPDRRPGREGERWLNALVRRVPGG